MERAIRLVVAYDGTAFHGWQRQPGVRTVQAELEQAARQVLRHPLSIRGSGRTDAGVHAQGQVAHLTTTSTVPTANMGRALNARLPQDVGIRFAHAVHAEFHATRSAVSKLYRYRIHNSRSRPVTRLVQRYCYHCWERIDVDAMRQAARHFVGTLDFSAMAGAGCVRLTMVRTVLRCEVYRHGREVRVDVEGTGFLLNQVRIMVGTLVEIGRGRWPASQLPAILASGDRREAGPTLPPQGLCLQWVRYPARLLRPTAAPITPPADPSTTVGGSPT